MGTKNAAMFAALHRDNLNTAKESIYFGTAKLCGVFLSINIINPFDTSLYQFSTRSILYIRLLIYR